MCTIHLIPMQCICLCQCLLLSLQAEERAEKEAQRQLEKDARNREREEAKKMARYPIEDMEVGTVLPVMLPCSSHAVPCPSSVIPTSTAVSSWWPSVMPCMSSFKLYQQEPTRRSTCSHGHEMQRSILSSSIVQCPLSPMLCPLNAAPC